MCLQNNSTWISYNNAYWCDTLCLNCHCYWAELCNHLCKVPGLCPFYRHENQEWRLNYILPRHLLHLICRTPFGGQSILKAENTLLKNMLGDQMFSVTFVESNFQRNQYFVPFFSKCESFLGWGNGLPVSPLFLPRSATFLLLLLPTPCPFQLWVIILWTWWEKSDFPSLHSNLYLGIIHHPPNPSSSHRTVKASLNRDTYSVSGTRNIIYVSV